MSVDADELARIGSDELQITSRRATVPPAYVTTGSQSATTCTCAQLWSAQRLVRRALSSGGADPRRRFWSGSRVRGARFRRGRRAPPAYTRSTTATGDFVGRWFRPRRQVNPQARA